MIRLSNIWRNYHNEPLRRIADQSKPKLMRKDFTVDLYRNHALATHPDSGVY